MARRSSRGRGRPAKNTAVKGGGSRNNIIDLSDYEPGDSPDDTDQYELDSAAVGHSALRRIEQLREERWLQSVLEDYPVA